MYSFTFSFKNNLYKLLIMRDAVPFLKSRCLPSVILFSAVAI